MWTEGLTTRIRDPSELELVIRSKVRLGSEVNSESWVAGWRPGIGTGD